MNTLSAAIVIVIVGVALLLVVGVIVWTYSLGRRKTPAVPKFMSDKENAGI
jgi:hypothetical protein